MNELPATLWARFELPPAAGVRLLRDQSSWAVAQTATAGALTMFGLDAHPALALGIAVGVGVVATRPARVYLLPLVLLFVVAATLLLTNMGVLPAIAAGAAAGLAAGRGDAVARIEAVLAGVAGAGLGTWTASELGLTQGSLGAALLAGGIVAVCTAQAMLPGALRWRALARLPSPGRIQATLAADYRAACMRAWQLDASFDGQAPDRGTRAGLREVATWVYRLALTLQTIDGDLARIDPDAVAIRLTTLREAPPDEDSFIRERRLGTVAHTERLLSHRATLALERARVASLQEYALAYLDEARAGLALARVLPGDQAPESLGGVLEKLRAHAAEGGARRQTARELGM